MYELGSSQHIFFLERAMALASTFSRELGNGKWEMAWHGMAWRKDIKKECPSQAFCFPTPDGISGKSLLDRHII
jgi:hypothetical protein